MKRFQLVVLVSAIVAGAIWWGFYRTHHTSSLAVASLLPKETLALAHVPDFNRSRADWHRTDLYQLWKEPAVQDFLAKPRASVPTKGRIGHTVEEIDSLRNEGWVRGSRRNRIQRLEMGGRFPMHGRRR